MGQSQAIRPSQFKSTKWTSADEKAKRANELLKFLAAGCPRNRFTKGLYHMCSNTFGHIAHYNIHGFYDTWFSSPARRDAYVRHCINARVYGDPEWTWSDVEKVLQPLLYQFLSVSDSTLLASLVDDSDFELPMSADW